MPTEDGVFFVGDSAGHCLPLTAEGIRTALYFGLACGRELRGVVEGRGRARRRWPATTRSRPSTRCRFAGCCGCSGWFRGSRRALLGGSLRAIERKRFVDWAFGHYLEVAHPRFVGGGAAGAGSGRCLVLAGLSRYLAFSQSVPIPASTASGGSISNALLILSIAICLTVSASSSGPSNSSSSWI